MSHDVLQGEKVSRLNPICSNRSSLILCASAGATELDQSKVLSSYTIKRKFFGVGLPFHHSTTIPPSQPLSSAVNILCNWRLLGIWQRHDAVMGYN